MQNDLNKTPVILQILPALHSGGVERGTIEVAKAIKEAGWTALVASSGGPLEVDLQRLGVEHIRLPLHSKNPFTMWKNSQKLRILIEKHQVDIIHARSRAPAWSAHWASKLMPVHFITTCHGTHSFYSPLKKFYNSIMCKGELVIAVSRHIAKHIQKHYGIEEERIRLVHRGVNLELFNPDNVTSSRIAELAQKWRLPDDKTIVMVPGRLAGWKGQHVLIHALAQLDTSRLFCIFVGSDKDHPNFVARLEQLAIKNNVHHAVRFTGHCSDMPAAYMLSDIVVSTSIHPEAFGRVIAEAQAMGRPVLASNIGGAREIIKKGKTGWLYKAANAYDLAEKLQTMLFLSAEDRNMIAEAAISNVRRKFSLEKMQAGVLNVYAECLGLN